MKKLILTLFIYHLSLFVAQAQCDKDAYNYLIKQGDNLADGEKYEDAVKQYSAAIIACPDKSSVAQQRIVDVFTKIEKLKKQVEAEKRKSDSLLIVAKQALGRAEKMQTAMETAIFMKAVKEIEKSKKIKDDWGEAIDYSKIDTIDLSGNALLQLPKEIIYCKNLKHINLLWNEDIDLKQVDSLLQINKTVNNIWLSINDWEKIPQTLKPKICGIDWAATELPNSDSDFWQQKQMIYLDVSGNELTSLSEQIGKLSSLTTLYLSWNGLTSLPKQIWQLSSLITIDLSSNQLTSLPEQIGQLSSLTTLNLYDNKLTSLPEQIGQLKNLVVLDLREIDCLNIASLCTAFKDYKRPIEITTSYNARNDDNSKLLIKIPEQKSLSQQIGQLGSLTSLILSYNRLTSLPEQICQLRSLITLNLYNNQLTSLPEQIGLLKNLAELDLWGNDSLDIVSLCTAFKDYQRPIEITTNEYASNSDNSKLLIKIPKQKSLPPQLWQLSSLTELDLSKNQLTSLPEQIGQLSSLTTLNLESNELTNLPEQIGQLSSLTELDLSKNQLTSLPEQIVQLSCLTELSLWNNQLTSLPKQIGQLSSLTTLNLRENQLTCLPEQIGQLKNLEDLNLTFNQLIQVPKIIGEFSQLKELALGGNLITEIPFDVGKLPKLKKIYLWGNPLKEIPIEIATLPELQLLYISRIELETATFTSF